MNTFASYEKRSIDFFGTDHTPGDHMLQSPSHLHRHIELVYVLSGETVCHIDTETHIIKSGDIVVIFPNQIHSYISIEPEKYLIFILNPDLTPELLERFGHMLPKQSVIHGISPDSSTVKLMKYLLKFDFRQKEPTDADGKYFFEIARKGALLALYGDIFSMLEWKDARTGSGDGRALRSIVNYCSKNFTRDLSLESLEEELHLSRYYISHLFSKHMRIRFNDYINSLRIAEACKYLRMTDKSITEISTLVGFGTTRTFNRAFNKQMNISPKEYRTSSSTDKISTSMPI